MQTTIPLLRRGAGSIPCRAQAGASPRGPGDYWGGLFNLRSSPSLHTRDSKFFIVVGFASGFFLHVQTALHCDVPTARPSLELKRETQLCYVLNSKKSEVEILERNGSTGKFSPQNSSLEP